MDTFLASYIETALWSSTDFDGINFDDPKYADIVLAEESLARMKADCESFEKQSDILFEAYRQSDGDGISGNYFERREKVAHDFWLTQNRHSAGFWDGDYPEPLGNQLTKLAHTFPECTLYVDEDGMLYLG